MRTGLPARARDRGTCSNKLTIRGDELEASILAGLQSRLMEPERFEQFAREFVAETNRQRSALSVAKSRTEAALARLERQIKRLVDAILEGADALPLNAKLKELDAAKAKLAAELEAAPDERPLLHPALAIVYRDRVAALAEALYDEQDGREAFERLRSVIEKVRLMPVEGQLAIELRRDLAEILRIGASNAQGSESAQKNALQIKVVAGAGFDRDLKCRC